MSETKKAAHHDRPNTDILFDKDTLFQGLMDEDANVNEWDTKLKQSRILPGEVMEDEPVCIWINDEQKQIEFGTLGNFSVISGKAKSKKSFTTNLVLAAGVNGSKFNGGPFSVKMPPNKKRILLFDTEQGRRRTWQSLNRVCRLAKIETPANLEYYDLRQYNPEDRKQIIHYALNEGNPEKDIGLVVIDGCRDLIHDINQPSEASGLVTYFMQWSAINMLHIVTIIHQNKGDKNARGHLGTELINKCETHISVNVDEKDKSISIVNPEETRDISFNPFVFRINEDGLPECLPDYEIKGSGDNSSKKRFDPYKFEPESHHLVLKEMFKDGDIQGKDNMIAKTKIAWGANGYNIGDSKAKEAMEYWNKMELVENISKVGYPGLYKYKVG